MLKQRNIISLSDRINKYEKYRNNIMQREIQSYQKNKNHNNSELYGNNNGSIEFFMRTSNKLNAKSKDYYKYNKDINNQLYNIDQTNNNEKLNKKFFQHIRDRNDKKENIRKIILSKKTIIEKLFNDENKKIYKDKSHYNFINANIHSSYAQNNRGNALVNNASMPELEINNKKNIYKVKNAIEEYFNNHINILNIKNCDNYFNKKILQEKICQINLNKTELFKKIKYAGLKKFCNKDLKHNENNNNKTIKLSHIIKPQNKSYKNRNNYNINNYFEEVNINSVKEKVRNYFIGKFDNIKEFFNDWSKQRNGTITINEIYIYLNNKINYKISIDEIKKLFEPYCKNNFLDLEHFKYLFFEGPSNEKLSIKLKKNMNNNYYSIMTKSSSEKLYFNNKKKTNNNFSSNENNKYNELLNLIKEQNQNDKIYFGKFLIRDYRKDEELDYHEFYNFINNIIIKDKKKVNYNNEIKKMYMVYKYKDKDKININNFFEKINDKNNNMNNNNNCNNNKSKHNYCNTTKYYIINNNKKNNRNYRNFNSTNNYNNIIKNNKKENNNNMFINIKKQINSRGSSFFEKKDYVNFTNYNGNSKKLSNIKDLKDSDFNKTYYSLNKTKEENEKKNKLNNDIKECKSQEIIKTEKDKILTKQHTSRANMDKNLNDRSKTQVNVDTNIFYGFTKLIKIQLPKIQNNKNKNLDIINLL